MKASRTTLRPPWHHILPAVALVLGVACGAQDPETHWAFEPVARPAAPSDTGAGWARNAIDLFIQARLASQGLSPAPEAGRAAWLRRVHLDLVGLPPAPGQVEAFVNDTRPDAHERVVEDLLASPRHGERWAQHWLDVVRHADTHGFEVNTERPHAWPYRDHVIRAFNRDTPYDRFVREQIVGDLLGEGAATGFLVTASVLLPGQIGADEVSKRLARQDALDEIVVNIGQTFLGLSVGCARCHDHKFDPITARDYFGMQAFVAGVEYEDREVRTDSGDGVRRDEDAWVARITALDHALADLAPLASPGTGDRTGLPRRPAVNARVNLDRFAPVKARRLRFTVLATSNLEPCIDEIEVFDVAGTNIASAVLGTRVRSSGDTVVPDRHELRFVHDGEYGNGRSWMSDRHGGGWVELEFPEAREVRRVVWGRDRTGGFADRVATGYRIEVADEDGVWRVVADASDRIPGVTTGPGMEFATDGLPDGQAGAAGTLLGERRELMERLRTARESRLAFAGRFRTPDRIHVLRRGDPEQPGEEVGPAIPAVLGATRLPTDAPEQERRRVLADWIADAGNPLTARVMVNRIWQGHFGAGLVETPSDFGRNGARPTHPQLLDWLASEFVASGWSMKRLHRLIVLSATYRQASGPGTAEGSFPGGWDVAAGRRQDAGARFLWRYPSRRLEAEAIRDAMLLVSGELDLRMYGRGFDLFDRRGGLTGFRPVEVFRGEGLRRMIYAHKVRREAEAVFGAFDCPDAGQSAARRRESTTPIQALNLFNSRFTLDRAASMAARIRSEVGEVPERQVRRAYRLAFGRDPTAVEVSEAVPAVSEHGLDVLCRAMFNASEFLFIP